MKNKINIKEVKSKLKKLLQESLSMLTREFSMILSEDSIYYDDFIIINGHLKELERDSSRGTISDDNKNKSLNKIRIGLLRIINLIDEEDIKLSFEKEIEWNRKISLTEINDKYENWRERYKNVKNWIEENFKEFDHWFAEKEVEINEPDGQKILENSIYKNTKLKIFGSYLQLSFTSETAHRWRFYDKEENFAGRTIINYILILNVQDLEKIEFEDNVSEDGYGSKFFRISLICEDGLKKIQVTSFNKFHRLQYDEKVDKWEALDTEGEIEDRYSNAFSLRATNKIFLDAFRVKLLEFKELINELK